MILAILQARTSSSRLPGKVLKPILGLPMLARQIERVARARLPDRLIVATSTESTDDALEDLCRELDVGCFRGAIDDVLDRFYRAAEPCRPEHVIRLTGDCPLAEPAVIDRVIREHLDSGADYTSNTLPRPTWPDGLDVELVRFEALQQAWREASLPSDREHVLPFVWRQPNRFRLHGVAADDDLSGLRWTVDEPADYQFVTAVYEALYPRDPGFGMQAILDLMSERPELGRINQGIGRNEGYRPSTPAALGEAKREITQE